MLLRKQLVQARKDLDDAIAAKNLLELEIAGYERLLSGAGEGRATRDKNATGGVAKAMSALGLGGPKPDAAGGRHRFG